MKKFIIWACLSLLSVNLLGQHDPGRNAVRLLATQKTDQAIKLVAKRPNKRNSPITDAERNFVVAMAACQQGDPAKAFTYAKQAVEKGLPLQRLQSGPRDILKALYTYDEFQQWIKTRQKQLLQGPLLGSVSDSLASFWVRTAAEADVKIIVQQVGNDKTEKGIIGKGKSSQNADYTAVIKVSGLNENTDYTYKVIVNNEESGPFKFRTFSKEDTAFRFKVAFGGGAGFTPQYERMWTTIGKNQPSALLLLGDNIYSDDPKHSMTQRYCYYRRQSQPEWSQLVSSTSVYSIYDDHDFGTNDCAHGPEIETPSWKRSVWETFSQNWNNPVYGGGVKQPGCWFSFYIGEVHFIMLDGRYYRDPLGGSMLGKVQKEWLLNELKSSKGKFKVVASPVPWSPGVKAKSTDTWDGFSEEREEIFSFIEQQRIDGVVLMAADRHRSDLRKIERPKGYDLYEVMSSRLTNVHTHPLVENAKGSQFIMGYNEACSFGLMEFDTTLSDPQVKYNIVNIDNEVVGSRTLQLSQLTFKPLDK